MWCCGGRESIRLWSFPLSSAHPPDSLCASTLCLHVWFPCTCRLVCRFDALRKQRIAHLGLSSTSSYVVMCIVRSHHNKGEEMHITPAAYRPIAPPQTPSPASEDGDARRPRFHAGHAHLWDRAISPRTIIRTAAIG